MNQIKKYLNHLLGKDLKKMKELESKNGELSSKIDLLELQLEATTYYVDHYKYLLKLSTDLLTHEVENNQANHKQFMEMCESNTPTDNE